VCKISLGSVFNSKSSYDQLALTSLENFIADVLLRGNIINCEELIIVEGQSAFRLCINLTVLSVDGNLKDALLRSALSALSEVQLPTPVISNKNNVKLDFASITRKISVKNAVPVTLGIFEEIYFVDPTSQEEGVMDGSLMCVVDPLDGTVYYSELDSNGISKQSLTEMYSVCKSFSMHNQ